MAGLERRQKILFGVLALLVVVFLGRMMLSGGGGGGGSSAGATATTLPRAVDPSGDDGTTDTTVPAVARPVAPEDDLNVGRNPFEAAVAVES